MGLQRARGCPLHTGLASPALSRVSGLGQGKYSQAQVLAVAMALGARGSRVWWDLQPGERPLREPWHLAHQPG